ncbi:TIGR04076 family protein [Butyrivibrio hungatei DSM 14810]|uniref:TIGR04076 family protein n=1 Tax=Butyrivibrio hungatei DSM 14810 TaxID=1121132 RepID=A0A1M7RR03_9FIRM|nr:hypothetical protein [Butyrivibrio hungatei]SHN48694.1 TIGR04076 family protein [Butyrivibrio hungatei DSM 14810]
MSYTDKKVKVTVIESKCPKYKEGDVICFEGSMLDRQRMYGSYECNLSIYLCFS